MKKLVFILIFTLFLPLGAHPFWILSAKSKTIKSAARPVKNDPAGILAQAIKEFDKKHYKKTLVLCRFIAKKYPDAVEASQAQYYMGRALEEMNNPYGAYLAYQKILDSYPNSKRIAEVVEREYAIAMAFVEEKNFKVLGLTKYDFTNHPAIEMLKNLADKAPSAEYAPKAQYQLGMLYGKIKRYDEAKEAFRKVIDKYPDSAWYAPAKYQLAQVTAKGFSGTDYDNTAVQEATDRLDEFLSAHPDSKVSPQAADSLRALNDKAAQKDYETGFFYEKRNKYRAAQVYYGLVLDRYPRTLWAEKAETALRRVEEKTR